MICDLGNTWREVDKASAMTHFYGDSVAGTDPARHSTRVHAQDLASAGSGTDELLASSPSADPLESSEWLYRMFDRDRRAKEVARLLSSSRPLTLRVTRRLEQTDHDFEHFKQSRLGLAANRQAALCVGRGAFTLGAVRPLPTELLHTPPLTLAGRFPPQTAVVSLDPNHHGPELNVYVWAEFGNGVATALQVFQGRGVRNCVRKDSQQHSQAHLASKLCDLNAVNYFKFFMK